MALTDPKIRQVKPKEKTFKIADEKGLYLEVRPNGSKYWRHKYRFAGKEKLLSHGRNRPANPRCLRPPIVRQ
jgi:hypothetical protein